MVKASTEITLVRVDDGEGVKPEDLEKIEEAKNKSEQAKNKADQVEQQIGKAEEKIEDAKRMAIDYITSDASGIMVAELKGKTYTTDTAPEGIKNVKIDDDSVDIRNGQKVLASFGENTTIGAKDGNFHIDIKDNGFAFYEGKTPGFLVSGEERVNLKEEQFYYFDPTVPARDHFMRPKYFYPAQKFVKETVKMYLICELLQDVPEEEIEETNETGIEDRLMTSTDWNIGIEGDRISYVLKNENTNIFKGISEVLGLKVTYTTEGTFTHAQIGRYPLDPSNYAFTVGCGDEQNPDNAISVAYSGEVNIPFLNSETVIVPGSFHVGKNTFSVTRDGEFNWFGQSYVVTDETIAKYRKLGADVFPTEPQPEQNI